VKNYAGSVYLTLDNNPIENKVRPFALGRKNWLFSNTPEGANAPATWYSLLETAKANGWNPQTYLLRLLEGLRLSAPLETLLPTNLPPAD
jgi:transposase